MTNNKNKNIATPSSIVPSKNQQLAFERMESYFLKMNSFEIM